MTDRQETAPDEYPLPVVGGDAVIAVMDAIVQNDDGVSERVAVDAEAEFEFLRAHNPEIFDAIAGPIEDAGLLDPETAAAAKLSMGITHALLHAQARIGRGLPPIDPSSDEYFLPVVTHDAATAYFTGEVVRQRAMGVDPYEDLADRNGQIPFVVRSLTDLPIGSGVSGGVVSYVAEFAAITTHGLLREQATMDAFAQGGGQVS